MTLVKILVLVVFSIKHDLKHRMELLNLVETELDKIRDRGLNQSMDVSLWRGVGGKFTSKFSSKDTWNQIRESVQPKQWYKGVWFSHSTPKYSFIVWLAVHDRLSTGDKMMMWNVGADPKCIFCQAPIESRDHLFFTCSYTSQVWYNLTSRILLHRYTSSFSDILTMMSDQSLSGKVRFIMRYVFQASTHAIWRERNRRRHGEVPNPPSSITRSLDRIVRNRLSSIHDPSSTTPNESLIFWFASRG
ncbi:hypothetical protein V5N11_026174 [Cardamine amara subsp. amara]|uniref:Reverse transcriptase zinc-binding domain-containing protein n=1 Tax=Cardamine amara subsp. amara TaxID=228776 RepID=A0ABD1BXA3_CARAN